MTLSPTDISIIMAALQESDWDAATVVIGDVTISVARNGAHLDRAPLAAPAAPPVAAAPVAAAPAPAAPAAAPASPAPAAAPTATPVGDAGGHVVTAPSVGVFWRAPEPGAAAFVEVGATVTADGTVGIVEIMKLMNNVPAGVAGTVVAIHVENGQAVEFGTPLFSIRPDAD